MAPAPESEREYSPTNFSPQNSFRAFTEWISDLGKSMPGSPTPPGSDRSLVSSPELELVPPVVTHLLDLDEALLLSVLLFLPTSAAAALSTQTCKAFRVLATDGRLWRAMLTEKYPSLANRWSLQSWGLPSYRAVLEAIERHVAPWSRGRWVLVSDHPWCQLVEVRVENARLIAVALRLQLRLGEGASRRDATLEMTSDPQPLFRVSFRSKATSSGDIVVDPHASVHGRAARVSVGSPEEPGDLRAAVSSTPYPPPVPYAFLAGLHQGADLLRVSWQPSTEPPEAGEVDAINAATPSADGGTNAMVPPLSSDWVVRNLEQKWRLARASPLNNDPKRQMATAIALSRLPMPTEAELRRNGGYPPDVDGAAMPALGLYACDFGEEMYGVRSVEVVLLRVLRLSESMDARRRLHLQAEPISKLGSCCLVATKVCGDFHVPSGASTFYAPLAFSKRSPASTHAASTHADVAVPPIAYDGPEEEVEAEATACYRSYGCLAAPGFRDAQYSEGRLITLTRSDAFYFEWMGDAARHVYHRLPDRPPCS